MKNSVRLAMWALACLIFGCVSADAQNITTIVGGGPGTGVAGSPALPARTSSVGSPVAVRFDSLGNMYVLDNTFGRVLKVNLTTGQTTTYAGNGTTGFFGNNVPATTAQLNGPSGMCIDTHDNLFIADSDNAVIRVVVGSSAVTPLGLTGPVTAGNIYTVVGIQTSTNPEFGGDGGPALSSHLHFPDGCAFDTNGNLYIADRGNNEIRVVLSAAGAAAPPIGLGAGPLVANNIYRFAGAAGGSFPTPPAGGYAADGSAAVTGAIYGPFDVFVDGANNVFFTDLGNNFDENGNPNTQTGTPPPPHNNNVVREVFASDGTIHTVAGVQGAYPNVAPNGPPVASGTATLVVLNEPKGLSMDSAGNLYFCDAVTQVIRKVTTPGVAGSQISVVAGTLGAHGFSGDTHAATSATFTFPAGSFIDGSGVLYIADVGSNAVRVVPLSGTFTGSGVTVAQNFINTIAGNGKLSYGGDGLAAAVAELNSPAGLAVDGSGNLSIADSGSDLIRYITASNGLVSTIAGAPENNGFGVSPSVINQAIGVATDAAGNVYFADTANCLIRKIAITGGVTTIAGVAPTTNPVCGFVAQGGAAVGTTLGTVNGIALDSHGNVFFSDSTNNVIWEVPVANTGNLVANNAYVVVGNGTAGFSGDGAAAAQAELKSPMGIYIDIYNNLFIADAGNHRIREVPAIDTGTFTAGSIYTIAGNGTAGVSTDPGPATSAQMQYPYAIVVDHNDNVFFTDTTFTLFPTGPTTFGAFSSETVREVVGKTAGAKTIGNIYTVAGIPNAAGFSGDNAAATLAHLNFPTGVALIPNGPSGPNATANLLISDSTNNRIRSVAAIANIQPVAIISFSPSPAVLPAEPIGTASPATAITLTNSGGATLNVSGVSITGTDAADFAQTNNCTAVTAGQTCTINVTFTPTAGALGARTAAISVADDAAGTPHSVNITGTAGTPTADLTPTSLTFASTAVGQTSPAQTVKLTNNGNVPTLITSIALGGANAGDYSQSSTCGVAGGIAAGANCVITVTFKPTATGSRTATLTIIDNVGTQTVNITGTGGAATLTLAVKDTDASSTQTVTAGSTATYNLSVTANEAVTATITCTGAPTAATCSSSAPSLSLTANTAGTFKVSVTTTARGELLPFNKPSMKLQPPTFLQIAPMASIALLFLIAMMLGWMQNEAGRARTLRVALSLALILMPIAAATVLVGCGGGSSSTTPPPASGTPAGTYTLTVTATSGSTTGNTTLTLVVN